MSTPSGERIDRIPAYIKRAVQDLSKSSVYDAVFWNPPNPYQFKYESPPKPANPRIYEAHGMCGACNVCPNESLQLSRKGYLRPTLYKTSST